MPNTCVTVCGTSGKGKQFDCQMWIADLTESFVPQQLTPAQKHAKKQFAPTCCKCQPGMTLVCSDAQQSACEAGLSKMSIVIRSNCKTKIHQDRMPVDHEPNDHEAHVRNFAYRSRAQKLVFPQFCDLMCVTS